MVSTTQSVGYDHEEEEVAGAAAAQEIEQPGESELDACSLS